MTLSNALGMTKDEKLEKLFRELPRESFPTSHRVGDYMQPGLFSWDREHVHFDFFEFGKQQRLTVEREEAVQRSGDDFVFSFAPSAKNEFVGVRTEFQGTAHELRRSSNVRKRAWNTLNEWCTPNYVQSALPDIMRYAERCYARIVQQESVYYFMPSEGRGLIPQEGGGLRAYVATCMRSLGRIIEPSWLIARNITEDQRMYLQVAWDQYEESGGKSRAPLRGLRR